LKLKIMFKRELQMIWICFFQKKEMEGGEGRSQFGGQWKEKEKHIFTFSHFPPNKFYLNLWFFPFNLKVLLYHGFRPLLTHFFPFPWPINYNRASWCNKSSTHSSPIWFWLKIFFPFLEIMASCMGTSYEPRVAQVNEESPSESSLDSTLMQHPHDEDLEPREVYARLKIEPLRA
jgi:hypothetical protein